MIRVVLILCIFASYAVSDNCVRYTFEQNFNEWLNHERNVICGYMPFWIESKYSDIDLSDNKNGQSTTFITPTAEQSCVSSFIFTMHRGGTIEVNIYMEANPSNYIVVATARVNGYLYEYLGNVAIVGNSPNFVSGWHTLKINLVGPSTYEGYISIRGVAEPNSTVLVDSFRYIPPGVDESTCRLYEDEPAIPNPPTTELTTTQEIPGPEIDLPEAPMTNLTIPETTTTEPPTPETSTPESTTPETSTLESTTPETSTPEPTTPETSTHDPTTPETSTHEPTTPETSTPEPTTSETLTPEPTTPETSTPEPTTPESPSSELTTPKSSTPEPTTPKTPTTEPTTPEIKTTEPTTPQTSTKELTTPETPTTELTTPKTSTPEPTTPKTPTTEPTSPETPTTELTTPKTSTPEPTTPNTPTLESTIRETPTTELTTPEISTPEPTTPEITKPEPKQLTLLLKLKMVLKLSSFNLE